MSHSQTPEQVNLAVKIAKKLGVWSDNDTVNLQEYTISFNPSSEIIITATYTSFDGTEFWDEIKELNITGKYIDDPTTSRD